MTDQPTQLSDCLRCGTPNSECAARMALANTPCCQRCWHVGVPNDAYGRAIVADLKTRYP